MSEYTETASGGELYRAKMAVLDFARQTLLERLMLCYPVRFVPGPPEERRAMLSALEKALKAQLRDYGVPQVIELHQLLDYAGWREGADR